MRPGSTGIRRRDAAGTLQARTPASAFFENKKPAGVGPAGALGKWRLRLGQYLGPLLVILLGRHFVRAVKLKQFVQLLLLRRGEP
jgi:hypothetical protein